MSKLCVYIIPAPVAPGTERLVSYAAAFIDPAVCAVTVEDGNFRVETKVPIDQAKLEKGLARLCGRFASAAASDAEPVFVVPPTGVQPFANGVGARTLFRKMESGLAIIAAPYGSLLRFLDHAVMRWFATPFSAGEEVYPNVIPIASLARTQHMASFPEHLHFVTHLREDLDLLEGYAEAAKSDPIHASPATSILAPVDLVHNPSTCYHCYAMREGARLTQPEVVTAATKCHRFEASNHSEPGRLMEFTLREVIFLGSGNFTRTCRDDCLELVQDWASKWALSGALVPASDPFFTDDFEAKATHQHRLAMKFEFRVALPQSRCDIAVLSANLHGPIFGKAFDIRVSDRVANTACFGVGLERLALAIAEQHGLRPIKWPKAMRQEYDEWRATSPSSFPRD